MTRAAHEQPILLVEDNPDDEALTLRALVRHRVLNPVVVTRDGAEALAWLFGTGTFSDRDPADVPALVLLDLKLPKIDGLEVLRRLRAHPATSLVPVVILTSSREEADRLQGYRHGTNSYVQKPVEFGEFADAVRQVGAYWLVLNERPPALPKG